LGLPAAILLIFRNETRTFEPRSRRTREAWRGLLPRKKTLHALAEGLARCKYPAVNLEEN
jgi:hypothetical protein